jgi:Putative peptidoglycan binding domain
VSAVTHQASDRPAVAPDPEPPAKPRRRRRWLLAGFAVAVAGAAAVLLADPFGGGTAGSGAKGSGSLSSTVKVTRGTLSSQTNVDGTLGYAGSFSVTNQASGIFTGLPRVGEVVRPGHVLYRVSGDPVVLLRGRVPAYRALSQGMSGKDVRELNRNLVALGYVTRAALDPSSDYFSSATKYGLELLQAKLGVKETGELDLGRAVFLPEPIRITTVTASLGTNASPGPVAEATSTEREVTVKLDASLQDRVKAGDRVAITMPDNRTIPGVVRSVGRVAGSSGQGSAATLPVRIAPRDPKATGHLDQAPVQVQITAETVKHALSVPVTALLALAGGGYAVEVAAPGGPHHLVAVKLGLFDDARGMVQVKGKGLSAGQRVVVPAA